MTILSSTTGRLLLAASVALGACSGEAADADPYVVRDSAGVTIVENFGDIWSAQGSWIVSAEPVLRIGAVTGAAEELFDRIRGIAVLADGRLIVSNGGTNTLRWFDPSGRFLFERGGEGQGPGEFVSVGGITLTPGDTLVVIDTRAERVTLFLPDGTLVTTERLAGLPGPALNAHRLSDGSYVTATTGFSSQQLAGEEQTVGYRRFPTPVVRVTGEPPRPDTIGLFPGMEMLFRVVDGRESFGPNAYSKGLHYAVHGDEIYVGSAERFEIDVFSPDGRRTRSLRAPSLDLTLTTEEFRATLLRNVPEERRAEAELELADRPAPPTRPAFTGLMFDREGHLWVAEHSPDASAPKRWAVFEPDGRVIQTVTLPGAFVPMTITSDLILGRLQDELGVQYVAGYGLRR